MFIVSSLGQREKYGVHHGAHKDTGFSGQVPREFRGSEYRLADETDLLPRHWRSCKVNTSGSAHWKPVTRGTVLSFMTIDSPVTDLSSVSKAEPAQQNQFTPLKTINLVWLVKLDFSVGTTGTTWRSYNTRSLLTCFTVVFWLCLYLIHIPLYTSFLFTTKNECSLVCSRINYLKKKIFSATRKTNNVYGVYTLHLSLIHI